MAVKKAAKHGKKIKDLAVASVGKKKERGVRGGVTHSEFTIKKYSDVNSHK